MNDAFKIYVEQLRDGHIEGIKEELPPSFLDLHESDLIFEDKVDIEGEAYLAEDNLMLHLKVITFAKIPCSICNEPVKIKIALGNYYHAEPLVNIKSGIFNFQEVLREGILLETPLFVECNEGKCPQREEMKKYLKHPKDNESEEEGYQPFADLEDV